MRKIFLVLVLTAYGIAQYAQEPINIKHRILVSTDIGGTDPDDNQSMTHLLMYSNEFDIEGLVSSPSFGEGSKAEILRMIDLYAKDLSKLKKHMEGFPSPDYLRSITKQGRQGSAPFDGYSMPTEGSEWIIKCAKEKSEQPLWILIWGGLDDLAQALHDAPEIHTKIRVYWIGGPNKKWSANSYAYIVSHFPDLWFIEANASYRGFFSDKGTQDDLGSNNYYSNHIDDRAYLGKDFKNYYKGRIKMGDTPSLLYLMYGDPDLPQSDHWGGSFEKVNHSPRIIMNHPATLKDTVPVYSIVELHFKGPKLDIASDSICFIMSISNQQLNGYHLGDGFYVVRCCPKQAGKLSYSISSEIAGLSGQKGEFVINNTWPGDKGATDYVIGDNWYTDRSDPELFDGGWHGAKTVLKWRKDVLIDWAKRWNFLNNNFTQE